MVDVSFDIDENGKPFNATVSAESSNLKNEFEAATLTYLLTQKFRIPEGADYSFPLNNLRVKNAYLMGAESAEDYERGITQQLNLIEIYSTAFWTLLAYLFLSLAVSKGRFSNFLGWLRDTSIPFGALFGLLFMNDAIYFGLTTSFDYIATAVLLFALFGLIGALAIFFSQDLDYSVEVSNFDFFLVVFILLVWNFLVQDGHGFYFQIILNMH